MELNNYKYVEKWPTHSLQASIAICFQGFDYASHWM